MQHSEIKCKFYRDAVNIVAVCVSSFCCRNQRTRIKKNGMKQNQLRETLFVCCIFAMHFAKSLTALLRWILRCVWSLDFFMEIIHLPTEVHGVSLPSDFWLETTFISLKIEFFPELPKSNFLWIFLKFNHPKITSSNITSLNITSSNITSSNITTSIAKKISLKWKNCLLIFKMNCNWTFVFGLSYCVGLNDPYPF